MESEACQTTISLPPNPFPKATRTRSPIKSPTPSSTPSCRRTSIRASRRKRFATPVSSSSRAKSRPRANVDYIQVARETIKRIGYDNTDYGIDYRGCAVLVAYDKQSPDIAQGVNKAHDDNLDQGAGDQGLMFGYACDETPELMPLPIHLSHRLVERQANLRRDGRLPWLRPDAKSQVTVRYVDGKAHSIDTVVLSTQHSPDIELPQLREAVIEESSSRRCRRNSSRATSSSW